jgi:hypothetical protein
MEAAVHAGDGERKNRKSFSQMAQMITDITDERAEHRVLFL